MILHFTKAALNQSKYQIKVISLSDWKDIKQAKDKTFQHWSASCFIIYVSMSLMLFDLLKIHPFSLLYFNGVLEPNPALGELPVHCS